MNPDLNRLQPYPFEKLNALKASVPAPDPALSPIAFSIGEPKHPPPDLALDALRDNLGEVSRYPATRGLPELREAIANWLQRRFKLPDIDPGHQVLPVNGTREALFAFAQAVVNRNTDNPLVVSPNPFYQIYEGAALLAGAGLHFIHCRAADGYQPDFDAVPDTVWRDCQLIYLCSPGNPSGAVIPREALKKLIDLSDRHDFVIASDECYSEIYFDESKPPVGLLQVCAELGRNDFRRCVVFHSLSKRSNLPGLRSGFVAGDATVLEKFLLYRTYHGCAMSAPTQLASIAAWRDEQHVIENRQCYREKFHRVLDILQPVTAIERPGAGFYLWLPTPVDDTEFAARLYSEENVTVLPGQFISRQFEGINPGANHVRIALVAELEQCIDGAKRLRRFLENG